MYYNIEYLIIMCPKYLIQYFSFFNVLHLHVVLVFEKIFICHIFHWLIISVKMFFFFLLFSSRLHDLLIEKADLQERLETAKNTFEEKIKVLVEENGYLSEVVSCTSNY